MTLKSISTALLALLIQGATAQVSPYFPAAGKGALHQKMLDLKNPAVVLSLAAEPGQEDLRTLARLRLHGGAKIVSAYATNGGATPSDLAGELPNDVAGRRKEEAHDALSLIGGEAYFLNLPDVGVAEDPAALEQLWQPDTLLARTVRMLRLLRPDLVLLARDARFDEGDTARWTLLRALLLRGISAAADSTLFPVRGAGPWAVRQVLLEEPGRAAGKGEPPDGVHPVWRKTAGAIAAEAGRMYASLRVQYSLRNGNASRSYGAPGKPAGRNDPGLLNTGPRFTRILGAIRPGVIAAAENARAGRGEEALLAIVRAGRSIEQAFEPARAPVSNLERRVLVHWKTTLEDLRCLLLGVDIPFTASDSVLAPIQLMFLRFPGEAKAPSTQGLEILFPQAMSGTWLVNETDKYRFPLTFPAEFRIVTPDQMDLNTPAALGGLEAKEMRTKFSFVIIHKDSVSTRDFAFRRDLPLRISPPQSVELLTPIVRVTRGERLVVRLQNVSREVYLGTMRVGDSVAGESRKQVNLNKKDAVVLDTLNLSWADTLPDGDHLVGLHIGRGKPVARFLARKFGVRADTGMAAGLLTGIASSPAEDALRRLQVPALLLDSSQLAGGALDRLRRVVLDRNALSLRPDAPALAGRLARWVRSGGHLVMLSQGSAPPGVEELTGIIGFQNGTLRAPGAPVRADSASPVCATPNVLGEADWQDWTIARARGTVRGPGGAAITVHVRDGSSGAPLVASARHGEGMITAVALDLLPQFQTVQAGAYRLLANLLAY